MGKALILLIFVSSFLIGMTTYSTYKAFQSGSNNLLRDPFEEHED
nr:Photosystem II reaction center protein N [Cutleria multifida]WAM62562.1 Photosystem II reaction center protein N [Cutleria multifida]